MKKIIITIGLLLGTTVVYAQKSSSTSNGKEQIVSTEDPHNPLVNGIPYSQYKMQVQNEEKQRVAKEGAAKIQHKEFLDKQAKLNLPPNPNVAEKPKK